MSLRLTTTPLKTFGHVIKLDGSLDTNTFAQLETEVQRLVAAGTRLVVLDLAALSYISSAGIRVVQKGTRAMGRAGGQLKLVNLQPQVTKVFAIIKAMPDRQIFSSIEELDDYLTNVQQKFTAPGGS